MEGESVEIGFNNRYLLDALRYSRCDKIVMEMSGPLSPVKVTAKTAAISCSWCFRALQKRLRAGRL